MKLSRKQTNLLIALLDFAPDHILNDFGEELVEETTTLLLDLLKSIPLEAPGSPAIESLPATPTPRSPNCSGVKACSSIDSCPFMSCSSRCGLLTGEVRLVSEPQKVSERKLLSRAQGSKWGD